MLGLSAMDTRHPDDQLRLFIADDQNTKKKHSSLSDKIKVFFLSIIPLVCYEDVGERCH
jgi:hypothetical protein